MVEVCIQHIIGTVALIGLVLSAGLFYSIYTSFVQDSNRERQLGQISETVALNLVKMINLVKFSKYSSDYMLKIMDLPADLSGRAYKIQLVDDTDDKNHDGVAQGVYVHTFLSTQPTVSADSSIPYNNGDIALKFNTTEPIYRINIGVENLAIACSGSIYGKSNVLIWSNLDWDNFTGLPSSITIGLGWMET